MVTEQGTVSEERGGVVNRLSKAVESVVRIPSSVNNFVGRWVDGEDYLNPEVARALGGALEAVAFLGVAGIAYAVSERNRPPRPVLVSEQIGREVDIEAVLDRIDQVSRGQAVLQEGEFFTPIDPDGTPPNIDNMSPGEKAEIIGGNITRQVSSQSNPLRQTGETNFWGVQSSVYGLGYQLDSDFGLYTCYFDYSDCGRNG